ncbi:hypothetical protein SF123566_1952, partial [Shigella flexneri 1235-66]
PKIEVIDVAKTVMPEIMTEIVNNRADSETGTISP